jgi:hypothetical protein
LRRFYYFYNLLYVANRLTGTFFAINSFTTNIFVNKPKLTTMKKQGLLLIAGGMLALASCQNNVSTGTSDAQIDSMVNARVEELRTEMMMQNDSLINAMAIMKADSICGAKKSTGSTKPAPKPSKPNASDAVKPGTTKPDNTKTTTRPGASNQSGTKTNDRPGATNQSGIKTTDRPGASNK